MGFILKTKMHGNVRSARLTDLDDILSLLFQLRGRTPEDDSTRKSVYRRTFSKMLRNRDYVVAVYEDRTGIRGTATLLIQRNLTHGARPYGHIENVVTDSAYRGKGIGRAVTVYLLERAKKARCYKVILDCNEKIIPFYEKCGLSKTESREMRINF
jgi:glucosamine-phosphate N-acetyltransferase